MPVIQLLLSRTIIPFRVAIRLIVMPSTWATTTKASARHSATPTKETNMATSTTDSPFSSKINSAVDHINMDTLDTAKYAGLPTVHSPRALLPLAPPMPPVAHKGADFRFQRISTKFSLFTIEPNTEMEWDSRGLDTRI